MLTSKRRVPVSIFVAALASFIAVYTAGLWLHPLRAADPLVKPTPIPNAAKPEGAPPLVASAEDAQIKKLTEEIKRLRELLPDQSHAMQDVSYHFTNLKFAADAENWPMAQFYLGETQQHLRWAVRLKPIRKDNAGREIDLKKILEALETTPLAQLKKAILAKDREQFTMAYKATLEGCYACHKAADKPYLRPKLPEHPETQIINFDPKSDWPK